VSTYVVRRAPSIPPEVLLRTLGDRGLSVIEMAAELGYAPGAFTVLYRYLRRYGIKPPGTATDALRRNLHLSPEQREVVVGTLLGDGCIPPLRNRYRNYHLQFSHSARFETYARWKAEMLAPFGRAVALVRQKSGYLPGSTMVMFQTVTHPDFAAFRALFYPDGSKRVPAGIVDLLGLLALAVWYMDDGTLVRWYTGRGFYCEFCCEGFPRENCQRLADALTERYGFRPRFSRAGVTGGQGIRIRLNKADSLRFADLIRPWVHPTMRYKLPLP
jgi:recombination protein RecA